jgi:hypothetical protein
VIAPKSSHNAAHEPRQDQRVTIRLLCNRITLKH